MNLVLRNPFVVLFEAVVIGLLTLILYSLLELGIKNKLIALFLTGMLAHILFEYTGMNQKWCLDTYKNFF